jgi:hypothetical protein
MRGDQVFELPFKTVCNGYCKKHEINPLSLYTMMQQGICDDMTRRTQRSSLFRNLLDSVKNDWGNEDVNLPDIFVVQNVDFEEGNMHNEENYLDIIKNNLNNFNSSLSENDDEQYVYDNVLSMKADIDDSLERNSNYLISLSNNASSPHRNIWGDMSTLMKSDYLQSLQDTSNDSNVLRYATKKINKEIPDETPQIFTNLSLLEILKLKKIEEYKRQITTRMRELNKMRDEIDKLLITIPKPVSESHGQSWLSYLMGGDISDESDTEDEIDDVQRELQEGIMNLIPYQPVDANDNDLEEVEDADEGVDEGVNEDVNEEVMNKDEDEDVNEEVMNKEEDEGEYVLSLDSSGSKKFNFF